MESELGDIRDLEKLKISISGFDPDVVFHLAAQPLVRDSYADPVGTYSTNVMGTAHVLEAVRTCDHVGAVVSVTTDKCYENREWPLGYREHEPMGGHDPYSSSKGCAELVTAAYRRSFFDQGSSASIATSYAEPLQEKFLDWMGDADRFVIIQGHDLRANESNFLPSFVRDANINLQMCSYEDWLKHGAAWLKGAAIMAELTFEEWLNLPIPLVRAMLERPLLNDPRLVLTVHDKGFLGFVNIEEITNEALSAEETAFIQKAFAETYFLDRQQELLDNAKTNPEDWILKPRKLGRSVHIIAGSLSSKAEWEEALDEAAENDNMILQKWHLSKKIRGTVQGVDYEDYFAGTPLYWGKDFFGPGFFRASCYPISNVKDNRMVTYFVDLMADPQRYPNLQWL